MQTLEPYEKTEVWRNGINRRNSLATRMIDNFEQITLEFSNALSCIDFDEKFILEKQ